eukprot:GHRR01014938.1.p1 GENE.GHRR01014938.1~~GHRR01014938.1.p1  ORF type:complete len:232 (+),score=43.29 GHRR01014938.1:70-696(+)
MASQTLNASAQKAAACSSRQAMPAGIHARVSRNARVVVQARSNAFVGQRLAGRVAGVIARTSRTSAQVVYAVKDGTVLDRPLRVAVIGGGPSGACTAETLAKGGIETYLIERKLDNCKPCGGAIPLCMVQEFDLPQEIIDRKVTKMKMISPSNREVDVGKTLSETEYIGMCRREVMDAFLRDRAEGLGAKVVNGLMMKTEQASKYLGE